MNSFELSDKQKLIIFKFSHKEKLTAEELNILYETDKEYFYKTGKHIVENYEEIQKLIQKESIGTKGAKMLDEIKDKISDVIEDIQDNIEDRLDDLDDEPEIKRPAKSLKTFLMFAALMIVFLAVLIIQNNALQKKIDEAYKKGKEDGNTDIVVVADDVKLNATTLLEAIAPAQELVSSSYNTADFDILSSDSFLSNLFKTENMFKDKVFYAYTGKVSAGVKNLKDVTIDIDQKEKIITVNMPKPEILHNEITIGKTYDINKSMFTEISGEQFASFQQALEDHQAEKALETPELWQNVKEKTELTLTSLIKATGDTNGYKILFNWQEKE